MHGRKMKRMENRAWRLALGGAKMLAWRTSDRASSVGGWVNVYRKKMERMENGAWRLALGGAKMLAWRTSDRASSVGGWVNVYRKKMERMENGAWRLALGGAKTSSVDKCGGTWADIQNTQTQYVCSRSPYLSRPA